MVPLAGIFTDSIQHPVLSWMLRAPQNILCRENQMAEFLIHKTDLAEETCFALAVTQRLKDYQVRR